MWFFNRNLRGATYKITGAEVGGGLQGASQLLGTLFGSGTTSENQAGTSDSTVTSSLLGDEDFAALQTLIQNLSGRAANTDTSKEAAIQDSQGAVQGIMRQLQESVLPQLFAGEAGSGAYNGTATKMLANDAGARAAEAGAKLSLDQILGYQQIEQGRMNQILEAFNIIKGARGTQRTQTTTTQSGSSGNGGLLGGIL